MASRSPTRQDFKDTINEIVKGITNLEKRLEDDVTEVCELLIKIGNYGKAKVNFSLPQNFNLKSQLQKKFSDIYWCLKLHLAFHLGSEAALQHAELKQFGRDVLELTEEQLNALPDENHAIDPGRKVLEALSGIVECPTTPKGSKGHADNVLEIAKALFCGLRGKNTFRPKVLAKVSLNEKVVVGSSVSVSPFLRPLCLHKRVVNFKRSLQRAVVFCEPLCILHKIQAMNWSSSAFMKRSYTVRKAPCQNCQMVFKNLRGFIYTNGEDEGGDTFLGACAEYVPVNELIREDDTQAAADIEEKLKMNLKRCSELFKDYYGIAEKCLNASESREMDHGRQLKAAYAKVKHRIHIFGFKPEIKM